MDEDVTKNRMSGELVTRRIKGAEEKGTDGTGKDDEKEPGTPDSGK